MNKIAIVTGTPGAGKTSILLKAGAGYKVVSIGTQMSEIAKKAGLVNNRDEMRSMRVRQIEDLRLKACEGINMMKGNIIIDTHASIKNKERYVPGFSVEELDSLSGLKAFVYVDSKAHEIIIRRARDLTRHREIETVEELDQQREINISLISAYAAHKNVPIYMIRNPERNLESAINQMKYALKEIFAK
jgi:adenylate kinase